MDYEGEFKEKLKREIAANDKRIADKQQEIKTLITEIKFLQYDNLMKQNFLGNAQTLILKADDILGVGGAYTA